MSNIFFSTKPIPAEIEVVKTIRWFIYAPPQGNYDCMCSKCGNMISDQEKMIKIVNGADRSHARYHDKCFTKAIEDGELRIPNTSQL